ncbi:MAG: redoxin domain-containing protein [Phycisphaerales bacterium]|nr:MAG: redoxin domain-containing protein [Planctomycetota bacterium]
MMKARTLLATIGLGTAVVILAVSATAMAGDGKTLKIGDPAPNFTLTDTTGKKRSLSEYAGRIVVLEWTNTECPVVQRCYKKNTIQETVGHVKKLDKDVVWLAINSTNHTNNKQNVTWIKRYELNYPILLDIDGTVGHEYDARRTPHMFVIDKAGILRYHGALDSAYDKPKPDKPVNYVVNAVQQLVGGETVAPYYIKPYGCSVKYKR